MANEKTVISISSPTPKAATWVFRIVYNLVKAVTIWIAATQLVPENVKVETMLILSCSDWVVWGIARGLGIKKTDYDTDHPMPKS